MQIVPLNCFECIMIKLIMFTKYLLTIIHNTIPSFSRIIIGYSD